jgi:hypothetical protein
MISAAQESNRAKNTFFDLGGYLGWFVKSAGVLLLITAIAKFVSVGGGSKILQSPDPVLGIPFKSLFLLAGIFEIVVAGFCFFGNRLEWQAAIIAGLCVSFVLYRCGLALVGYERPCPCLGNLTDALHISPTTGDAVARCILAYLILGSCATLSWWRFKKV